MVRAGSVQVQLATLQLTVHLRCHHCCHTPAMQSRSPKRHATLTEEKTTTCRHDGDGNNEACQATIIVVSIRADSCCQPATCHDEAFSSHLIVKE